MEQAEVASITAARTARRVARARITRVDFASRWSTATLVTAVSRYGPRLLVRSADTQVARLL
jgi:hypothetical protein